MLVHQRGIFRFDRHTRSDRAATDAEVLEVVSAFLNASEATVNRPGVRGKFLSEANRHRVLQVRSTGFHDAIELPALGRKGIAKRLEGDRKSTRLNSSHSQISYAVFCLKKKKKKKTHAQRTDR